MTRIQALSRTELALVSGGDFDGTCDNYENPYGDLLYGAQDKAKTVGDFVGAMAGAVCGALTRSVGAAAGCAAAGVALTKAISDPRSIGSALPANYMPVRGG